MDKLLKLLLGNHQSSSAVGYVMLAFTLWQEYSGQFNSTLALLGVGLFFLLRFANEHVPGLPGLIDAVLVEIRQRSNATLPRPAPVPNQYEHATPRQNFEQALLQEQRDALGRENQFLKQQVAELNQRTEAQRAQTQTRIDALPAGRDALREG